MADPAGRPSYSGMVQAGIRYLGTFESDKSIRTQDALGWHFLEGKYKVFQYPILRWIAISSIERQWPGGYGYSCVRSRVGDEQFAKFTGKQIINLGAGFCTRLIRFSQHIKENQIQVFELDLIATQQKKRRICTKIDQDASENVEFIPVDFTKQSLETVLLSNPKYSRDAQSLFIWEGVTMYINEEDVDATFAFIHKYSAPGSLIVFDYVDKEYVDSKGTRGDFYGGSKLYNVCKQKGELLKFGISQEQLGQWLNQRGFELVRGWKRAEMENEFLQVNGKTAHKADGPLGICIARTV